jgi:hypothetical protein
MPSLSFFAVRHTNIDEQSRMDVTRPSLRRIALGFMLPSYDEKARAEREFPACGLAAAPVKS